MTTDKSDQSAVMRLTSIITPNLVNEAHMAYQRYVVFDTSSSPFTNPQVGITPTCRLKLRKAPSFYFTFTSISASACSTSFPDTGPTISSNGPTRFPGTTESTPSATGFEAVRVQVLQDNAGNALGCPTFQSFADFLIGRCAADSTGCTLSNGAAGSNIRLVGTFAQVNAQYPVSTSGRLPWMASCRTISSSLRD